MSICHFDITRLNFPIFSRRSRIRQKQLHFLRRMVGPDFIKRLGLMAAGHFEILYRSLDIRRLPVTDFVRMNR
jgi:hypothetical protein